MKNKIPLEEINMMLSGGVSIKNQISSSLSRLNLVGKRIWAHISQERSGKSVFTLLLMCLFFMMAPRAKADDVNVLIIGPTNTLADQVQGADSKAFQLNGVKERLKDILDEADGIDTVNVEYQDTYIARASGVYSRAYGLVDWFFYHSDAKPHLDRWENLRGEGGKDWDYVILLGDAFTMEYLPAAYFEGVAHIAAEVKKGGGETVLLMPWPSPNVNESKSTVDHYKEIVYRAGRTGGYKVVPAGLAWQAAGEPSGASHPTVDGAFVTAASIYSRIWGKSASTSDYEYNDNLANTVHTSVQANIGVEQFTGPFICAPTLRPFNRKDRRINAGVKLNSSSENQLRDQIHYLTKDNKGRATLGDQFYVGRFASFNNSGKPEWHWAPPYEEVFRNNLYKFKFYNTDYAINQINATIEGIYKRSYGSVDPGVFRDHVYPILFGQLRKREPDLRANWAKHHSTHVEQAMASFIFTMYTGRCGIVPETNLSTAGKEPTQAQKWDNHRIGYETAWRMMHGTTRVPGFRVQPSSALRNNVMYGEDEINTVTLAYRPEHDVTVNVTTNLPGITVSPTSFIFTPYNYNQPQTVTISVAQGVNEGEGFTVSYNTSSLDIPFAGLHDKWDYQIGRLWVVNFDLGDHGTRSGGGALVQKLSDGARASTPVIAVETGYEFVSWDKTFNYITGDVTVTAHYGLVEDEEFYGSNLLVNGGGELGHPIGNGWHAVDGTWSRSSTGAYKGNYLIRASAAKDVEAYQDVDVSDYADTIATGLQSFSFTGYVTAGNDEPIFDMLFRDVSGVVLASHTVGGDRVDGWVLLSMIDKVAPVGTTQIRIRLRSGRNGSNSPGYDDMRLVANEFPVLRLLSGDDPINSEGSLDMGPVIQGRVKDLELTISNSSSELDMNLTGSPPVSLSGNSAFTIVRQPAKTQLAPGETTTFTIRYTAPFGEHEQHTAQLIIGNNFPLSVFRRNVKAENPKGIKNLVLNPIHDGDTFEDQPDSAYGFNHQMEVKGTFTGNTARSLMKFDLTGVADRPYRAILRLYKASGDNNVPVSVSSVENDNWREGTLTWNNAPASGDTIATVPMAALGWYELDITDEVKKEFSGDKYISLALEDLEKLDSSLAIRTRQGEFSPELVLQVPGDGFLGGVINFNSQPVLGYSGSQDKTGTVTIGDDGSTLNLTGNRWKAIEYPYTVTKNTVIEFDFQSNNQGEVHAIGFDDDLSLSEEYAFKLYGTQPWAIGDYNNYSDTAPGSKHYKIRVGEHYTGLFQYLFFVMDDDARSSGQSIFSNIRIYEADANVVQQDSGAAGLVSMEAENYNRGVDASNKAWIEILDSNASGGKAMDSTPDIGDNLAAGIVRMEYDVNFVKTGIHYVWVRGRANPRTGNRGNADSLHAGLDGDTSSSERISKFSNNYNWSKSRMNGSDATINVTSIGTHVFSVSMREDGVICDKIVLTTDVNYTPIGNGPANGNLQRLASP